MTQPVKFGLNVDPNTGGLAIAERITAIADASGLDLVGVQDHPYNDGFTDTLTPDHLAGRQDQARAPVPQRRQPAAAPAGHARQAGRRHRRAQRRPFRARPRRGSVRGRDRRDGRPSPQRRAGRAAVRESIPTGAG